MRFGVQARAALEAEKLVAQGLAVRAAAEANAIIQRAEAQAKAIRMKSKAEADAKRKQLEALGHTPPSEWLRQIQVACSGVLRGATVTVAPESTANLSALMGAMGLAGGRLPGLLPSGRDDRPGT